MTAGVGIGSTLNKIIIIGLIVIVVRINYGVSGKLAASHMSTVPMVGVGKGRGTKIGPW